MTNVIIFSVVVYCPKYGTPAQRGTRFASIYDDNWYVSVYFVVYIRNRDRGSCSHYMFAFVIKCLLLKGKYRKPQKCIRLKINEFK